MHTNAEGALLSTSNWDYTKVLVGVTTIEIPVTELAQKNSTVNSKDDSLPKSLMEDLLCKARPK